MNILYDFILNSRLNVFPSYNKIQDSLHNTKIASTERKAAGLIIRAALGRSFKHLFRPVITIVNWIRARKKINLLKLHILIFLAIMQKLSRGIWQNLAQSTAVPCCSIMSVSFFLFFFFWTRKNVWFIWSHVGWHNGNFLIISYWYENISAVCWTNPERKIRS